MPSAQRRPAPGVIERLREAPYQFEFFQAVRVLVAHFRKHASTHADEDPVGEHIRFGNSLNIGFAPSEIEALQFDYAGEEMQVAWPERAPAPAIEGITRAHIVPAFFGLTGNQGTLPRAYTEQLIDREITRRDRAARAFLDLFSNRATALFYRAWEKYRLYFQYERDRKERFLPMALSFLGAGQPSHQERITDTTRPVLAETLAYYAGALRHISRPAHLVERIVADYFQVPVRVVQFRGRWHTLPTEQLSTLGGSSNRLGIDTLCGARVWHVQTAIELQIGPLDRHAFERFLPGGEAARAIEALLVALCGLTLECTVRPILRKEDVRPVQLGSDEGGGRLGHNTWALTRLTHEHRADVAYHITHEDEALAA